MYPEFVRTGVHSHDDGVMHWHPFTSAVDRQRTPCSACSSTPTTSTLTNDTLKFPDNNVLGFTDEYKEGETKCNGEDAELSVKVWDSYTDTDAGNRYIANMDRIHIDHDGMVFGIYFTPKDAEQVMPPWSSDLPSLGAVDTGQVAPDDDRSPDRRRRAIVRSTAPARHRRLDAGHVRAGDATATTPPASTAPPTTLGLSMYAVVLVGGFGTRLRPLTDHVPKPMLPIVHRPMIVRLVERLAAGGVSDVVLALGFKPEPFRDAFPDGRHGDVRIHYAVEPEPLDTAGAIAFAARAGGRRRHVRRRQRRHHHRPRRGAAGRRPPCGAARRRRSTSRRSTIRRRSASSRSTTTGVVRRFVEKPAPGETDSNLINAGTYVLEPSCST